MKKIILGLSLLAAATLMSASAGAMDNVTVPSKVRSAFHHEYKNATAVAWTKKDGRYDVSFRMDGKTDMIARYDFSGHRIDTRMPLAQSAMPVKVVGQLEKNYPGGYSHSFTKIERPWWRKDLYMTKVKENGSYKPIYFDKNGHVEAYASR